jgi:cyclophilin family peptidyl-prolyl cis-trans isomerase
MILAAALALMLLAGCLGIGAPAGGPAKTGETASDNTSPAAGGAASGGTAKAAPNTDSIVKGNAPAAGQQQANNSQQVNNVTKTPNPIVVFETTRGIFKAEIFVNEAPISGNNFMKLVRAGFYNGLTFHRVVPDFVVQGGDPKGDGSGGSNQTIPLEIVPTIKHKAGSLGMARKPGDQNSATSQFYVVTGDASFLDGEYAVFGQVMGNGMNVVQQIQMGDKMTKVYEQK